MSSENVANKPAENQDLKVQPRIENDFLGEIEVPGDVYYGCQTQRAIINYPIGGPSERVPVSLNFLKFHKVIKKNYHNF